MLNSKPHLGVKCKGCKDVIFSEYGHDFKYCKCGATFVDGGKEYLRYGWDDKVGKPISISREAYLNSLIKKGNKK